MVMTYLYRVGSTGAFETTQFWEDHKLFTKLLLLGRHIMGLWSYVANDDSTIYDQEKLSLKACISTRVSFVYKQIQSKIILSGLLSYLKTEK